MGKGYLTKKMPWNNFYEPIILPNSVSKNQTRLISLRAQEEWILNKLNLDAQSQNGDVPVSISARIATYSVRVERKRNFLQVFLFTWVWSSKPCSNAALTNDQILFKNHYDCYAKIITNLFILICALRARSQVVGKGLIISAWCCVVRWHI